MPAPTPAPAMGADPENLGPAPAGPSWPPPSPAGASPLTSLEGLETSVGAGLADTPTQRRVHAPWASERAAVVLALASAECDRLQRRARTMAACCCSPLLQQAADGSLRVVPIRCRERLCPLCAARRAREVAAKYGEAVGRMGAARHVVLTAPAVAAGLADQLRGLRDAMRRLRASPLWRRCVTAGVYTVEVTFNAKTGRWHPHLHIIADGHFIPHAELRAAWRAALAGRGPWAGLPPGSACIVHVSAVHNRHLLARYIAKYIAKPAGLAAWPPAAIREYAAALVGVRMMHTFGGLHGVKLGAPQPNADPAGAETLIGLAELSWRAGQGWACALRAQALFRRLWPSQAAWVGSNFDQAAADFAAASDDPQADLRHAARQTRAIGTHGPPPPPPAAKPDKGPLLDWPPG